MAVSPTIVESIFARMLVRYGSSWLAKYPGVKKPEEWRAIHADWASLLDGLSDWSIEHGLANLPIDFPPNAAQFRAICSAAPARKPLALPEPDITPEQRARNLETLRLAREKLLSGITTEKAKAQVAEFRERLAAGERLSFAQREWLAAASHLEFSGEMPGDFTPIPPELLPVAMRPDAHTVAPDEGDGNGHAQG